MKKRGFLAVSGGIVVLGVLLLMSGSPAVTPAGAQNPTPQQQLRQILEKLDQVLADIKASSEREKSTKSRDAEDN